MKLLVRRIITAAALAGACLCGQNVMAQNVVVGTCTNSANSYTTIQDAVSDAPSGATVLVCPGTYKEQVEITEPLTLTGIQSGNADAVVIASPDSGLVANTHYGSSAQVWVHDTSDVTITNLTVDGSNSGISKSRGNCRPLVGILFENTSGTVADDVVRNQTTGGCSDGYGIAVESVLGDTYSVTVRDNAVGSFDNSGIVDADPGMNATIRSNSVVGPGETPGGANGIGVYDQATGTIRDNSIINALTTGDTTDNLNKASCGVASVQAGKLTISGNVIGNTQCGVGLYSSDNNTIASNTIFGTQVNDGVYVCGNGNAVRGNTISDSGLAGIDLSCADVLSQFPGATANNNKISNNTINGAKDGILIQHGTAGNLFIHNQFFDVGLVILIASPTS